MSYNVTCKISIRWSVNIFRFDFFDNTRTYRSDLVQMSLIPLNVLVTEPFFVITIDVEAVDELVVLVEHPSEALAEKAVVMTGGKLEFSQVGKTSEVVFG